MSEILTVRADGLLFDMDGVLISSIGSVLRCWRRWAIRYKVPGAESFVPPHGVPARDIIAKLAPQADATEALRYIEQIEMEDMDDLQVLPGVRELLGSLDAEHWTIVTSATRRLLVGRLEFAGLPLPAVIITADDVVNGKPDPEPYRRGAEAIHKPIQQCIVIEDAPTGVRAGKAAGARVLAVLGTSNEADLWSAGADWVVDSLEALKARVMDDGLEIMFEPLVSATE